MKYRYLDLLSYLTTSVFDYKFVMLVLEAMINSVLLSNPSMKFKDL